MSFKSKIIVAVLPIAVIALTGCATNASQGGKPGTESGFSKEVFNVEKLTCWDLGTISEEDAGYAATLLYGYAQGKQGDATQTPSKIENALSEISQKCAGNPDMLILSAFK